MNNQLREETRCKLIDEKVGLTSQDETVSWADSIISELDEVPDFLISISLREPTYHMERLDLIKEKIVESDYQSLAQRILSGIEAGKIDFDKIELVSLNMAHMLTKSDDSYLDFMWVSDELHLADS